MRLCRSSGELGGAKAQRRTVSMTCLVLGSALALCPRDCSTNSVCRLPQVTGPLPSLRRARRLIVALPLNIRPRRRHTPESGYPQVFWFSRIPGRASFSLRLIRLRRNRQLARNDGRIIQRNSKHHTSGGSMATPLSRSAAAIPIWKF
jgi:hypothetical protein